ncbi:MAG: type 4a pilus biogenesis protein PilO [Candidatus Omnitrophica bacterium]|nr:type 4a pilus biogenesis protein PilO [Candidatus Omnitrophota bacterium]
MIVKRLSKRESQIFILCILVFLIYIGFQFVYKPIKSQEDLFEKKISVIKKKIKKNLNILKEEGVVKIAYDQYLEAFAQKLSDQQEMSRISSEIEAVAKEADIKIIDMKPQRIREESFFKNFSLTVQTEGTMNLIMKFLYFLEQKPHHFQIEEVRLEKRSIRSQDIRCEIVASRILLDPSK